MRKNDKKTRSPRQARSGIGPLTAVTVDLDNESRRLGRLVGVGQLRPIAWKIIEEVSSTGVVRIPARTPGAPETSFPLSALVPPVSSRVIRTDRGRVRVLDLESARTLTRSLAQAYESLFRALEKY